MRFRRALLVLVSLVASLAAQTVTMLSLNARVAPTDQSFEGHAIIVRNGALVEIDGLHRFHSLTDEGGGM